jgi:holo-[acyl-carrier protein] synthase
MIIGIGTDIVEIDRIEKNSKNNRFLERIFTFREKEYCFSKVRYAQHLAARFASKEACIKALGCGVSFLDIEVLNNHNGKPELLLHGEALRIATNMGVKSNFLSISHSRDNAIAFVILSGD